MSKNFGKATDLIDFSRSSGGTALRKISYGPDVAPLFSAYEITNSGTWAASGSDYVFEDTVGSQVRPGVSWPTNGLSAGIYLVEINIASITGATQVRVDGVGAADQLVGAGESSFVVQVTSKSTPRIRIEDTSTNIGDGFALTSFAVKPVLFDQADGDLVLFNHFADIPRVEYAADGSVKGLLVEEARTNLLTYSEDFTDASWVKASTTVVPNAATAPDGSNTADLIYPAVSGNYRHVRIASYSPWTGLYTGSFYAKYAGIRYAVILDSDAAGAGVGFDIQSGTYTISGAAASDGTTASITDVGGGWYRCSYTSTNGYLYINLCDSISGVSVTADGTSGIYIYGAQLEAGAFPTSYIPTSGATATRSADVASIDTSEFGYRQDEGTVVVEAETSSTAATNHNDLNIKDASGFKVASSGSRVGGGVAGTYSVYSPQTSLLANVPSTVIEGNTYKAAYGLADNDFAVSVNGSSVVTDTSVSVTSLTATTIEIGDGYGYLNGHIKSIKYIPRRLTNAQLQELST